MTTGSRASRKHWRGFFQPWQTSLRIRMSLSVASMLLPMLVLVVGGYLLVRTLVASFEHVADEALEELSPLIEAQSSLLHASTALHTYAETDDVLSREQFYSLRTRADEAFQGLQAAPFGNQRERSALRIIEYDWGQARAISVTLTDPGLRLSPAAQGENLRRYDNFVEEIQRSLDLIHDIAKLEVTGELHEAEAAQQQSRRMAGVVFLVALSMSVLAGVVLGRSVLRPLGKLKNGARLFGTGDLSHRIAVERLDELGQLADVFNTMAQQIERSQKELSHQASHDGLTGLVNRGLFRDRLKHALTRAKRHPKALAVMVVDLDGFKRINDSLGHSTGDDLLMEVGRRLSVAVRDSDTAARLGGDEFAVLVEDLDDPRHVFHVAERIIETFREPFVLRDKQLIIQGSVGIATSGDGNQTAEELLRNADLAMYAAKRKGQGRYEAFDSGMFDAALLRMSLEAELRQAVDKEEFILHYQPVVDLATHRITGVEALVRWQHPTRGLVPPAQFIPLAEDTGLILPIGRWVLREACRQTQTWQAQRPDLLAVRISVNISVKQLEDPRFVDDVAQALRDSQLAPEALILEITESVLVHDPAATGELLQGLKRLGVRLAVDDFGIGYSSLNYLRRLPVDIVKIDKTFVSGLARPEEIALTTAIIALSKALKLQTLAEGVEQAEQAGELRALGCDSAQGFYFTEPLEAARMSTLLNATHLVGDPLQPAKGQA